MTTIRSAAPSSIRHPPPMDFPVAVKAVANDPAQKVSVSADRTVTIKGTANNRGIVRSFIQLSFNGQKVSVNLSGGETPAQVKAKINKALPDGYKLATRPSAPGTASFQILKTNSGIPMGAKRIDAVFAAATKAASGSGTKVNVAELRKAVEAGLKDDNRLDTAEKDALARNWASLFTGAGWEATQAAQKEYAKLQKKFDLPVYPVR